MRKVLWVLTLFFSFGIGGQSSLAQRLETTPQVLDEDGRSALSAFEIEPSNENGGCPEGTTPIYANGYTFCLKDVTPGEGGKVKGKGSIKIWGMTLILDLEIECRTERRTERWPDGDRVIEEYICYVTVKNHVMGVPNIKCTVRYDDRGHGMIWCGKLNRDGTIGDFVDSHSYYILDGTKICYGIRPPANEPQDNGMCIAIDTLPQPFKDLIVPIFPGLRTNPIKSEAFSLKVGRES
jgi:hypothetical protein